MINDLGGTDRALDGSFPKLCPKCGDELIVGYGLAGDGCGAYVACDGEGCDFFEKQRDADASEEAGGL